MKGQEQESTPLLGGGVDPRRTPPQQQYCSPATPDTTLVFLQRKSLWFLLLLLVTAGFLCGGTLISLRQTLPQGSTPHGANGGLTLQQKQEQTLLALLSTNGEATPITITSRFSSFSNTHDDPHNLQDRWTHISEALHQLEGRIQGSMYYFHDSQGDDDNDNDDDDDGFARASHVWSERSVLGSGQQQQQQAPWVVIEVNNEQDVQTVVPVLVELQTNYQFPFRIRSGRHNKAGHSTVAQGAVLSLVRLNHISELSRIRPSSWANTTTPTTTTRMVRLGPAVLVQDFIGEVLVQHGYGGVTGYCGTVAEGGFILGGGLGLQSRLYGLGLDNAVGMRVVLADGSVHYVSDTSPSIGSNRSTTTTTTTKLQNDLFWALRGAGGGSFGVVTEIEYLVHKAEDRLLALTVNLEPSDMAVFLYRLGKEEPTLPGNLMVMHDRIDTVGMMWSGQDDDAFVEAAEYLDELVNRWIPETASRHGSVQHSEFAWSDMYVSLEVMGNFSSPPTWGASCWYGFMMPENNTEHIWQEIIQIISEGTKSSAPYLLPDIELWGGAIRHKPGDATAFPYRDAVFNVGVLLTVPTSTYVDDPEDIYQREVLKINAWWPRISQYLTGSYVNYPVNSILSQNNDHARLYWGDNLERLVEIKQRVDPQGAFNFPLGVPVALDDL